MDNIIAELINIENKAREVALSTEEEIKKLPQRIEARKKEIYEEIEKETEEKLKEIDEIALKETDEKVSQILADTQDKCANIEKLYTEVHEKLEDKIFHQIIGR